MKKIAIAALALTGFAGSAFAADMAARPVYKAPPPAAPAYSWTGCYLGAGGGAGMSNNDETAYALGGGAFTPEATTGRRGWFGTVQGGCDYQFNQSWVIGAFADYDFGSIKADDAKLTGGLFSYGEEKQNWSWAVGVRVGWLPLERLMTYVSAGYTQSHDRAADYSFFGAPAPTYHLDDHTYDGWFVGTGYEYYIGWFPGLTWKTEYRFADYGSDNQTVYFSGTAVPAFTIDREKFVHTVRSELVWRFNLGR
jgi:outer membrane immunogenic protein